MGSLLGFVGFNLLAFLILKDDQKLLFSLISFYMFFSEEIKKLSNNLLPSLARRFKKHPSLDEEVINHISEAVFSLSKDELGAIIVIENFNEVGGHINSGFSIEAKVHSGLIEAIFHTYSPLHDGAMIIKDHRIEQVGAILPLSKKEHLPKHYGTRHRAGIGISDLTDCDVIVVSEETGKISHIRRGEVFEISQPEELIKRLST